MTVEPGTPTFSIEEQAKELAHAAGFAWSKTLRASVRKQTVAAEVYSADGTLCVWKCQVAPDGASPAFDTEKRFYLEHQFRLAPRLVSHGPRFIALEHIDGPTLRDWLIRPNDLTLLSRAFEQIVETLAAPRSPLTAPDATAAAWRCADRIYNLLISGPVDARRSRFGHSVASQVSAVWIPLLRRTLVPLYHRWAKQGARLLSPFGHNDLHTHNVLLSGDRPWVIDFERVTHPGFWHIDALYLFATIYAALETPTDRSLLMRRAIAQFATLEPSTAGSMRYLIKLFAASALSNGRFRGTTWYDGRNVRSLLRVIAD
jgi:hypothetical protein